MQNALEPIRPGELTTTVPAPTARRAALPAQGLFDIAAAPPRVEAGSRALLRAFWLPFAEPSQRAPVGSVAIPVALALTRDTLAPAALCDAAQEALVETADRQDESPARFAAKQNFVQPSDLPSCNAPHAQSHARKTLLARDEGGDLLTLDLHVSRLSESRWEATAFDRAGAARGGAFPYAEPPLGVAALSFDPGAGRLVLPEVGRMLQLVSSAPARPRALHLIVSGVTALILATLTILVLVKAFA